MSSVRSRKEAVAHLARHVLHRVAGLPALAVGAQVVSALHLGRVVLALGPAGLTKRIAQAARDAAARGHEAALLHGALQLGDGRDRRVVGDGRRLRDRVRVDREHTGMATEPRLDDRLLACAVLIAHVQDDRRAVSAREIGGAQLHRLMRR
jgi:hypothetical protein